MNLRKYQISEIKIRTKIVQGKTFKMKGDVCLS